MRLKRNHDDDIKKSPNFVDVDMKAAIESIRNRKDNL